MLEGTKTILLVDDEDLVLEVGTMMLKRIGFNVLGANCGSKAIEVYKNNMDTVDLVILDLMIPDERCSDTFKRIRELNPNARMLLASGFDENDEVRELMKLGNTGFIQKPFTIANLSEKASDILNSED